MPPHLSTKIIIKIPRVSTEWKARVEAQTKGERKSRKGGRSLVLVLTETSLSNFHFWVVSLFYYLDWKKDPSTNCVLFCQRYFFRPLHKEFKNRKNLNKGAYAGRGAHYFFIQGGGETSLITSHRARGAPNPPTYSSIMVFSWLAPIDPYCIGIRRPFYCCHLISLMFDSTLC